MTEQDLAGTVSQSRATQATEVGQMHGAEHRRASYSSPSMIYPRRTAPGFRPLCLAIP